MPTLVSDRTVTALAKLFVTGLVVVTTGAAVGTVVDEVIARVAVVLPPLYVTSVVFVGVWQDRLTTARFTRALLVGFLALLDSLWDPTAAVAPLLVLPVIVVLLWPTRNR